MEIPAQFSRYATVGLAANGVAYILYPAMTWSGVGHKTAMILLYAVGVSLTFLFNRK